MENDFNYQMVPLLTQHLNDSLISHTVCTVLVVAGPVGVSESVPRRLGPLQLQANLDIHHCYQCHWGHEEQESGHFKGVVYGIDYLKKGAKW